MNTKSQSNSEKYPEAWKIYADCVRKWKVKKQEKYPKGWKYGIPNPADLTDYLWSDCPGKLFIKFKTLFYEKDGIRKFRKFLWWLEHIEGKISNDLYESNLRFIAEH